MAGNFKSSDEIIKEKRRDLRREIVRQMTLQNSVVFFGSICVVGFIVSLYFLIEMAVRSFNGSSGISFGDIIGMIIIVSLSFFVSVGSLMWFKKYRKDFFSYRV
ncbi:hypothetical protein GF386_04365 [Candidatus Pacearchaeota archaeon]|nr:hypothetical protein [Candidatus Pacearchaeota archaeon]MBD3283358.1 hypothetical protein [Candidatus Pacearchaeota archaeon]